MELESPQGVYRVELLRSRGQVSSKQLRTARTLNGAVVLTVPVPGAVDSDVCYSWPCPTYSPVAVRPVNGRFGLCCRPFSHSWLNVQAAVHDDVGSYERNLAIW